MDTQIVYSHGFLWISHHCHVGVLHCSFSKTLKQQLSRFWTDNKKFCCSMAMLGLTPDEPAVKAIAKVAFTILSHLQYCPGWTLCKFHVFSKTEGISSWASDSNEEVSHCIMHNIMHIFTILSMIITCKYFQTQTGEVWRDSVQLVSLSLSINKSFSWLNTVLPIVQTLAIFMIRVPSAKLLMLLILNHIYLFDHCTESFEHIVESFVPILTSFRIEADLNSSL